MTVKGTEAQTEVALYGQLVAYRRILHENPELSAKEFATTERIRRWLSEEGMTILNYPLETGLIAEVVGALPGPTIALRADIDALPVKEATGLPFVSETEGIMHACGHDYHTAAMIGAALLLRQRKAKLKGTVRFIFQPAEEIAQGAKWIEEAGALEGVSAIFGMHNKPDLPVGTIGIREGGLMASADRFELDIIGVGGHAGIPDTTIDPIVIAGQVISGLQTIISRNTSPFHNVVISITQIHGGNAWNVIPEKVFMEGTVRTFQKEARERIPALMKRTVEGIAESFGARADFRWIPYISVVDNDPQFKDIMTETAKELGYNPIEAKPVAGGEDFAHYQTLIPGFFVFMGVEGTREWHHPEFNLKEEALLVAAKYFSTLAIKVLDQWETK